MPVRYAPSGDHHDRDDYSFYIRDHGSRNFARSRRFVEEDGGEESRTMSLVSNPLQVPIVGRRSVSPARGQPSPHRQYEVDDRDHDWEAHQVRRRPQGRPRSMHTTVKERGYPYVYDDFPLQPLVPTYQPRRNSALYAERHHGNRSPDGRSADYYQEPDTHQRRTYDDRQVARDERRRTRNEGEMYYDEEEYDERSQQPPQQHHRRHQQQDHELQSILNWRKRPQEPLVHTDFGYEVPPIRRRADPSLQDVDDSYGAVTGYVAKRRQFAVENDDDMQYYRNPNYQYRMHGMDRPLVTDKDVEDSMERSKLDRAPMFEMKIRSHVVWEKMNVKFTCTVRGTPTPTVTWYKNMVPLEPSLHNPGKYKISKLFGLHTLEINRASIEDSGTYRVSLQNRKGEISCYATLLVRRYDGGKMGVVNLRSGYNMRKPTDYPDVEGLSVPDRAPHTSRIEVNQYDELPDTDAARRFKSQLDNLDFDVSRLMKAAKFEKDLSKIGSKPGDLSSQTIDTDSPDSGKGTGTAPHQPLLNCSGLVTFADGERRGSGISDGGKGYLSDVSTDNSDHSAHKNRFKVAIEVSVTNENRRDSLEPFEKRVSSDKKSVVEMKDGDVESKAQEATGVNGSDDVAAKSD